MASWSLVSEYQTLARDFGSLETVFSLEGERLTRDPLSEVIRIERDGVRYYVSAIGAQAKGFDVTLVGHESKRNGRTLSYLPSGVSRPLR